MKNLLAFVGFGEAGYNIAKGLKAEGLERMVAYDVMQDNPEKGALIHKRAEELGITLASSLEEAVSSSDFVFALTHASVAVQTAKSVLPYMKAGQTYVDLNSCGPNAETEMDNLPWAEGVLFCDGSMLDSVPKYGHKVNMYLAGAGAHKVYDTFKAYNMNQHPLDAPAGGASAIKMFRSVFSKGLPQLLLECMVPAAKYGVMSEMLATLNETYGKWHTFEEVSDGVLDRTLIHAARRVGEVHDVVETVEAMGYDASMSRSTEAKLLQLAAQKYDDRLGMEARLKHKEVIELLVKDMNTKKENES